MHAQEEDIRQTFLAHSQPLWVLSSSICVYNDRMQEYLLSRNPQAEGLTAGEFSRLTAEINSTLKMYPEMRQPEERALLESLQRLLAEQQDMASPVLSWSQAERRRQAVQFLHEKVLPVRTRIHETSERIALWNTHDNSARRTGRCWQALRAYKRSNPGILAVARPPDSCCRSPALFTFSGLNTRVSGGIRELARSRGGFAALSARLLDAQETEAAGRSP